LSGFNFLMVERSRKASLHAFCVLPHQRQSQKLFTQNRRFFFTSSQKTRSLACEDISFRLRSITLVKRSACAAREVAACRRVDVFLFTALRLHGGKPP